MKPFSFAALLALVLVSCTGDDDPSVNPSPTDGRPPSATVLGRNLDLLPGAEGAVRIAFTAFGSSARVIARYQPTDAVIDVCPIAGVDADIPERSGCERDVRTGVRETIGAPEMGGVAIVSRGDAAVTFEFVVEYEEGDRAVELVVPVLPAPAGDVDCSDNACNPFFELQPTRAGPFTANVTWEGPDARFVLLQGSVLGRAQTATGIPYREPARDQGASPLSLSTSLEAPAEYAVALMHARQGSTAPPMRNIRVSIDWP